MGVGSLVDFQKEETKSVATMQGCFYPVVEMSGDALCQIQSGDYRGELVPGYEVILSPENVSKIVVDGGDQILAQARHRVLLVRLLENGRSLSVVIKSFGKQRRWKDRYDWKNGTKAARSFRAARLLQQHEIGTPDPIGYFERWNEGRLCESYYISQYIEGGQSFKEKLDELFLNKPDSVTLVSLLEEVGEAMRKMHDAGFWHRDLGNQNIFIAATSGNSEQRVMFIDLNRGKIRESLTSNERAQDFSRIRLPSYYMRILLRIYWGGKPPGDFIRKFENAQKRFALWQKSRKWRHPLKSRGKRTKSRIPAPQDLWVWDPLTAQPTPTLVRNERTRLYPKERQYLVAKSFLRWFLPVGLEYDQLMKGAYAKEVCLKGRIGMALELSELDWNKQVELLKPLGEIPVLARFYHHEEEGHWELTVQRLRSLSEQGHEVMVALVQDRRAVLFPEEWSAFMDFVIPRIADFVTKIELCHAVNRMKWGVHSPSEQKKLLEAVMTIKQRFPHLCFTGPACIDFEYHYVLAALTNTPEGFSYGALSHHLYVDRRGAPENLQGRFDLLAKCGLLKAIATCLPQCDDKVIVSEVNWPLENTGIWSPVGAVYRSPDGTESKVHVTEKEYGIFMLRYLAISLCSGFVDQVYWWRLAAHGYGLVDERKEGGWRARPAYEMLVHFINLLGDAVFLERLPAGDDVYFLKFQRKNEEILMVWSVAEECREPWPTDHDYFLDAFGKRLDEIPKISSSPVYGVSVAN